MLLCELNVIVIIITIDYHYYYYLLESGCLLLYGFVYNEVAMEFAH